MSIYKKVLFLRILTIMMKTRLVAGSKLLGVLNQDTAFPNLADSKDIILRALMLFVIYRKPEALKSIRENKSFAELGERVWLIAAVISVSTIGMRKLPADLKFSEPANENRNF